MADTGWLYPTSRTNDTPTYWLGTIPVADIQTVESGTWKVLANDPNRSTSTTSVYGISIPDGSTIDGIEVTWHIDPSYGGVYVVQQTYLSWNGGSDWVDLYQVNDNTPDGWAYWTLGGATSKWGRTWSVSDFSDDNFRLKVHGWTYGGEYYINVVWVKVYYTEAADTYRGRSTRRDGRYSRRTKV